MTDHADIVREFLDGNNVEGVRSARAALAALVAELAKAAVQDAESIRKVEAYDAARAEVKRNGHSRAEYVLRAEAAEAERDEARVIAKRMSRTPAGEFDVLKKRAETAEAEVARLTGTQRRDLRRRYLHDWIARTDTAEAEVERLEAENDAIIEAVWRALPEHGGTCPRDDPPTTKTPCIRCCVLAELNSVRAALAPKEDDKRDPREDWFDDGTGQVMKEDA